MAPKRKAPGCVKVQDETADGIKYVRNESGMLIIGTSSFRRTVRHAGDDVEVRVEQELSRDGGALRKLLAPEPAQRISASSEGECSAAAPLDDAVPTATVPTGAVPTATVLTAAVPTATVSRPQSPQPLSASQESADIGVLIACAAACMPWSNPDPDNGPLSRSDKILLKDHDRRLAYRCAMCRGKSCSMALTRAQCQRRAASRDAGLYAQWQMGSRVRDLIITPVWHMRPVLAVGRTSFGTVAPVEHFEIVIQLPLGPLTALKQYGSATVFKAEWSFPVAETEQGVYAEKRGGRRVKGRYRLQVRWPSPVIWERVPRGELSHSAGKRRGWIHERHCSLAISPSMRQATAADRRLMKAAIITFQVPLQRRESSLFSTLARKEGEEGRGLHPDACPCEICKEWREGMLGGSAEDEQILSGFVLESGSESDDGASEEAEGEGSEHRGGV